MGLARASFQVSNLQSLTITTVLTPYLGTAPTLNRSTLSEAKAASAARPARVFADAGGKYGKGLRPQGVRGNPIPPYKTRDGPLRPSRVRDR